ncbi:ABC transporter ATP-binding protein [Pseudobutyrivibrio xylanivorans]|uniref:NitT/TauT family transport system ATP-binding protein n=1 Tax=Pseudobutyrivibrio xylanivorans TaxID=185007 RepID=A0A1G5RVG7_PSEXY|nr:ABC transporter ATP-binding protein [Pseudobutyrivibrio xylanivorans]SCZ77720.1 NitT/TauT family transport system ATP-binding protein [Pseudobutyrivibrio xylanivorans]
MAYIHIENAGKTFLQNGQEFTALSDVNLDIERGEFICLLGPSGCGKSTLLNAIAGFDPVNKGSVSIDGNEVKNPSITNVTIFQNYGLLPWRTVLKNVELGLESKKVPKSERAEVAKKYLEMVKLSEFENSFPHQLSGGMQQRVAIARALAVEPEIIFMDEPFGALDAITRMKLQDDILDICKEEKKTIIFVTHDIEEAVYLADRIVVMTPNPGKVKGVITVPLHHFRDRTSGDFLLVRDKIFDLLNMKTEEYIEYTI